MNSRFSSGYIVFLRIFVALLLGALPLAPLRVAALGQPGYVQTEAGPGSFCISRNHDPAGLWVDPDDYSGVIRAARDLQTDIARVTGERPGWKSGKSQTGTNLILIGTVGKSALMERLIQDKKIDVSSIAGKWESFFIQVVPKPLPGIESALVICGSDKRGTIYGIYDLSEQSGFLPGITGRTCRPNIPPPFL